VAPGKRRNYRNHYEANAMGQQMLTCSEELQRDWPDVLEREGLKVLRHPSADQLYGKRPDIQFDVPGEASEELDLEKDVICGLGEAALWIRGYVDTWCGEYLIDINRAVPYCVGKQGRQLRAKVRSILLRHGATPFDLRKAMAQMDAENLERMLRRERIPRRKRKT